MGFLYRRPADGKRCEIGLGGALAVTLARPREKAAEARTCVVVGRDPLAVKTAEDSTPTFGEVADRHIATNDATYAHGFPLNTFKSALQNFVRERHA